MLRSDFRGRRAWVDVSALSGRLEGYLLKAVGSRKPESRPGRAFSWCRRVNNERQHQSQKDCNIPHILYADSETVTVDAVLVRLSCCVCVDVLAIQEAGERTSMAKSADAVGAGPADIEMS
jgi:hypothetical protein